MAAGDWSSAERPTISALITSYNEEERIASCIEGLRWCDEIVLIDSYSTDRTGEIASGIPGVRLIQHTYYGGAAQKNWGLQRVSGDWVLIFDSDEVCTPALRDEIQRVLLAGPRHNAYEIRRQAYFLGKRIRFSGWQHDRVVRLFRRGTARYANKRVHARLLTQGPAPMLRNPMEHYMVESVSEYARRITRYSHWGAAQAYRDGKRASLYEVVVRPLYRFIRTYFLQFGFLDGMRGLIFCAIQAAGAFHKWASLWGFRANERRGVRPDLPEFEDEAAEAAIEPVREGAHEGR